MSSERDDSSSAVQRQDNVGDHDDGEYKQSQAAHMSTSMKKSKVLSKLLGVSEEEMRRNNALRRLGVTEEIVDRSREILKDVDNLVLTTKEDCLLGFSQQQRNRSKAVRRLGVSEEDIADERSRQLGRLGQDLMGSSTDRSKSLDYGTIGSLSSVIPTLGSLSSMVSVAGIIGTGNNNGVDSSSGSNLTGRERSETQNTSREDDIELDIELRNHFSSSTTRHSVDLDGATEVNMADFSGTAPKAGAFFDTIAPR